MPLIPYMSRLYVAPPIDPDSAVPIATRIDHPDDFAIVSSNESGQYKYTRQVKIKVETAFPLDIPVPPGHNKPITILVTTAGKEAEFVHGKEVFVTWFPYSSDWEQSSAFKGHNNRSTKETKAALEAIAGQVANQEMTWEDFFRDKKGCDPFQGNRLKRTAYFLSSARSVDDSSKKVFSQRNQSTQGGNGKSSGKWLAFGICDNIENTVEEILNEPAMQYLLNNQDASFLVSRWKDHELLKPFYLRPELLEFGFREIILRCAIRKAIAGPIRNQKAYLNFPVSKWATSVFLEALYNLNRRAPEVVSDDVAANSTTAELRKKGSSTTEPPIDFKSMVGRLERQISEGKHRAFEKMKESAIAQLTLVDQNYKLAGLAGLASLSGKVDLDDSLKRQISSLKDEDTDPFVREAAEFVLSAFSNP